MIMKFWRKHFILKKCKLYISDHFSKQHNIHHGIRYSTWNLNITRHDPSNNLGIILDMTLDHRFWIIDKTASNCNYFCYKTQTKPSFINLLNQSNLSFHKPDGSKVAKVSSGDICGLFQPIYWQKTPMF